MKRAALCRVLHILKGMYSLLQFKLESKTFNQRFKVVRSRFCAIPVLSVQEANSHVQRLLAAGDVYPKEVKLTKGEYVFRFRIR